MARPHDVEKASADPQPDSSEAPSLADKPAASRPPSSELSQQQNAAEDLVHGDDDAMTREKSRATSARSTKPAMGLPHEIAFVTLTSCAQLFTQAGLAQSIAPLHIMAKSFGEPSAGQLSWFTAAYSLTVGTFILIAGRLGDMYGHKRMFMLGWAWYSVWSLVSGLTVYSHSQIFLDVCRALQGIGPAILLPSSLAILGQTYPPGRRKEMVFAIFGATAPNGFCIGAVFSSLVAQFAWWPWAYWLMAIVCFANMLLTIVIVPNPHHSDTASSSHGPQTFDYLGAATGVVGLVLFNVAWNQAPIVGWGSPYIIVLLILGVLFFAGFVVVERRVAQPLVPIAAFDSHVAFVLACMALGWSSFGIWLYYFWQLAEVVRSNTPLSATAQVTPTCVSGICAALTVGFLLSRVKTAWIMCGAMVAFCVGNVLLATLPREQLYWKQLFWAEVVTPWGMDMSFPAATIILSNHVPKRHQGIAASLVTTVVNYSISWGLGIAGTVEANVNDGGANVLKGYRGAWYSAIGLSGCGIALSLWFVVSTYGKEGREEKERVERVEREKSAEEVEA